MTEQLQDFINQLGEYTGGGEMVPPRQTMEAITASRDPRLRGHALERFFVSFLNGNRNSTLFIGRFVNAENDLRALGESMTKPVVDWGVKDEVAERCGPSVDTYIQFVNFISRIMGVHGYTDYGGLKGAFGHMQTPKSMAQLETFGIHDLNTTFNIPGFGEVDKPLTLTFMDVMSKMAFTRRGNIIYNAKNSMAFDSEMMGLLDEMIAEKVGIPDLAARRATDRKRAQDWFVQASLRSLNGVDVRNFGQLKDHAAGIIFHVEKFLNVFQIHFGYSQQVEGGYDTEHARAESGEAYFGPLNKLNAQAAPEMNGFVVYPDLLSLYAKNGFNRYYDDRDWAESDSIYAGENSRVREAMAQHFKEVFTISPRYGQADVIEADMLLHWINGKSYEGEGVTDETIRNQVSKIPELGSLLFRPPEMWETVNERLLRTDASLWQNKDVAHIGKRKGIIPERGTMTWGKNGMRWLISGLAKKGVGAMDYDFFDSRLTGTKPRYDEKMAATMKALVNATELTAGTGGTLSQVELSRSRNDKVATAMNTKLRENIKKAVEGMANIAGDFIAVTDTTIANEYFMSWLYGITRAHLVPYFSDKDTVMIDIDWDLFAKSNGEKMVAKYMLRKDIEKKIGGARMRQFDELVKKSDMRWALLGNGDEYLIGSSGRPLFKVANSETQFDEATEAVETMEDRGNHPEIAEHFKKRLAAMKKEKRFSINWMAGLACAGGAALYSEPWSLVETVENAKLITERNKNEFIKWIKSQMGAGGGSSWNDGWANMLGRPLGVIRPSPFGDRDDPYLPVAPADQYIHGKGKYERESTRLK